VSIQPTYRPGYLERPLSRTIPLSQVDRPLLNLVPALRPGLIIGRRWAANHVEAPEKLAPTAILDLQPYDWRASLMAVGEVVGRAERAKQWRADYERDAAALSDRIVPRVGRYRDGRRGACPARRPHAVRSVWAGRDPL
jgi:ABC-type Fe3+-hydroxamate transport system substrate-binding protein